MQNLWKMFENRLLLTLTIFAVLSGSCTQVYFEKPVPQKATAFNTIPADWAGVYLSEPAGEDEPDLYEQLFPQCFRLERLSETQLLVASEYRIHEKDLPRLRSALEEQKDAGKVLDYVLSENMLLYTVVKDDSTKEQQYTALLKTGPWYVLTQTMAPFRLFDLKAGQQTDFDLDSHVKSSSAMLPDANSIESEGKKLVARQTRKAWYFNSKKQEETRWSLLYVEQPAPDQLVVQLSYLENSEGFKKRIDYFNAITPFRSVESGHYAIDPDDKALERLLAEKGLFQTTTLRRIAE